jgi:hypothetical protein
VFESFDDGVARFAGESQDPICSRQGNPTPSLSPFNGFLLHQGIESLSLRIDRHIDNSLAIARWLTEQPEVESVDYAELPEPLAWARAAIRQRPHRFGVRRYDDLIADLRRGLNRVARVL